MLIWRIAEMKSHVSYRVDRFKATALSSTAA
jgi:hypothetical protein